MPMTKSQVIAYLAEEAGITKKQGAAVLNALAG
jgi:nucleoid DNA-binding protein